mmetsp:Transcript_60392/g.141175  ORF Transcript_60392/g.141175 Transcript_60392/m.141175 type:complete len:215 (-) Transcript_60392:573-1217(-)
MAIELAHATWSQVPHPPEPQLHGMLMWHRLSFVQGRGDRGFCHLGEDGLLLRVKILDEVAELVEGHCVDKDIGFQHLFPTLANVFYLHRGASLYLSDPCTSDVLHLTGMLLCHVLPQGLETKLEDGEAGNVRGQAKDGFQGRFGNVRVVPPQEVERGDRLQQSIALHLLRIDENGLQHLQAILLQELGRGHVDLAPVLGLRRQAVGVTAEDFEV